MKKNKRKQLLSNIENQEYINENNDYIFNKLKFNPLIRIGGLLILLIFSLINNDRIHRLARITSNAIFSNENILGPTTYYTVLGLTIGLCLLVSFFAFVLKPKMNMASIEILRKSYRFYSIYDLVVFVLSTFVCLFFIIMILITPCNISGDSMNDTYQDGDRVLIWNIGYEAQKNDVIVFDSTNYISNATDKVRFFIKRVQAVEGNVVSYTPLNGNRGSLRVDGTYIEEISLYEYQTLISSCGIALGFQFVVPKNYIMVLGDNRAVSNDSRSFGFIQSADVVGKVLFRFYPFNHIGNPEPDILT